MQVFACAFPDCFRANCADGRAIPPNGRKAIKVDGSADKSRIFVSVKATQDGKSRRNHIISTDNEVKLEVRLEEETVWLTQVQMTELFQTSKQNVSLHTKNIFKEKELSSDSVVKDSLTTAADGKKYRVKYFLRRATVRCL